jgi:ABC-type Fe3+ transport system permease subunit
MAGLFLAMTAYLDLPTGQLLAPAGLASAPVTLYTQMHYGRNSLLTAMTLLAVAIPWTLALFLLMVLPRLTIWRRR